METEIRLSPVYGGFGKAIFSDQQLNLGNALIDNGNQGNEIADSLALEAAESQKGIKSQ